MIKKITIIILTLFIFFGAYFAVPQAINPLPANNVLAVRYGGYTPGAYKVVRRFGITLSSESGVGYMLCLSFYEGEVLVVNDSGIASIPSFNYRTNKPAYIDVDVSSYINKGNLVLYIRY